MSGRRGREQVLLDERDAFVSTSRVEVNGTTYATANITSVAVRRGQWHKKMLVGGAVFVLGLLWPSRHHDRYAVCSDPAVHKITWSRRRSGELAEAINDAIVERG